LLDLSCPRAYSSSPRRSGAGIRSGDQ